jgi:capsular exopolysaccharide synthesis family protein
MNEVNPLARYIVPLRRWWFVVAGAVVLALGVTFFTLPDTPDEPTEDQLADPDLTFRASYLLIRNEASPEPINFDLVELLARQGDLTNRVLERMDGQIATRDVDEVDLVTDPELGTISITAIQPTPALAGGLASTYAEELQAIIDGRAADSLQQSLERIEARLQDLGPDIAELENEVAAMPPGDLDRRLAEAELEVLIEEFAINQSEARTLQQRLTSLEPQFETLQEPEPVSTELDDALIALPRAAVPRLAIGGLLGLLAGGLLAILIARVDTRVRTREDAEGAFGLPVIAEVPLRSAEHRDEHPVPVATEPDGGVAEVFRSLRLSIMLAPVWRLSGGAPSSNGSVGTVAPLTGSDPSTLVVTSPGTGDGKSTTVANLAASFAESGSSVLVVDCDFRRPAVGELLGVQGGPGLRDLGGVDAATLQELVVATEIAGISMVRSGSAGIAPAWFLSSAQKLVTGADELADVVIFDTGPLGLTNEATALIPAVDATVLVDRAGRVSVEQARRTVQELTRVGAKMAGVVLVGANSSRGYGYYAATDSSPGGSPKPTPSTV